IGVHLHPTGSGEDTLHGCFGAEDQEIDHVAGVALFVADAAGNLREKIIVNAGQGGNLPGWRARAAPFGRIDLNADGECSVAGVAGRLVNAKRKAARDGCRDIAEGPDKERLCGVLIADTSNKGATSSLVKGQNAEK